MDRFDRIITIIISFIGITQMVPLFNLKRVLMSELLIQLCLLTLYPRHSVVWYSFVLILRLHGKCHLTSSSDGQTYRPSRFQINTKIFLYLARYITFLSYGQLRRIDIYLCNYVESKIHYNYKVDILLHIGR